MFRGRVLLACVLCCVAAQSGRAQYARGAIRDTTSGEPVPGVVVWLSDSAGRTLVRGIADDSGRFALSRVVGGGALHFRRIGFRPRDVALGPNASDTTLVVTMRPVPLVLTATSTTARRACSNTKEGGAALELWEQARSALLAGVVARETRSPRVKYTAHSKRMAEGSAVIEVDSFVTKESTGERAYVAARTPIWLATAGYMREGTTGDRTYYAPDEETLLDETFVETHCLHVTRDDRRHRDQIGIGFEPTQEQGRDTLVDVKGTVWLDRKRPALRSVEFEYTGLEHVAYGTGGEIVFATMPAGFPIVQRWHIRMAELAFDINPSERRAPPPRPSRTNARRIAFRESGGEVLSVQWPNGVEWHSSNSSIVGTLSDPDGRPAPNVRVWLQDTPDTVTTDSTGTFKFAHVRFGLYAVLAADSALASHGLSRSAPAWVRVANDSGAVRNYLVAMLYESRLEALRAACRSYQPDAGFVAARVMTPDGKPAFLTTVQVSVVSDSGAVSTSRTGLTDIDGRFVVCGMPAGQRIVLRATKEKRTAEIEVRPGAREVTSALMVLKP
jgi:hypothetical protein